MLVARNTHAAISAVVSLPRARVHTGGGMAYRMQTTETVVSILDQPSRI